MKTEPPGCKPKVQKQPRRQLRSRLHLTPKDPETAVTADDVSEMAEEKPLHGVPLVKAGPPKIQMDGISHYALAKQMTNYHSIDVGNRCEYNIFGCYAYLADT